MPGYKQSLLEQSSAKNFPTKYKIILTVLILTLIGLIGATIGLTVKLVSNDTKSSSPSPTPPQYTMPKNLIIMIGDGMGETYNTAYRNYKNLTRTTLDKIFRGRYSTNPMNKNGITDSAAGATVFSTGYRTLDRSIAVDQFGNPHGSILAAAKRQQKGTGIIATKSVTDATPAAFTSHSLHRDWNEMIAKQQFSRLIDDEPMIDIIFGGGKQFYDEWDFFDNYTYQDMYGWNAVFDDYMMINNLTIDDLPMIGLFADENFDYYVDRMNSNDSDQLTLSLMSMKAIELLSTKYEDEGFFMMIEGSLIDKCGHDNDVSCLLHEMDEFVDTVDNVIDWIDENDHYNDTLLIILADHETGGLVLGRDGSFYKDALIDYWDGQGPIGYNVSKYWAEYIYNLGISEPIDLYHDIEHYGMYKWIPFEVEDSLHSAKWIAAEIVNNIYNTSNIDDELLEIYELIEMNYIGGRLLTNQERKFVNFSYQYLNEDKKGMQKCIVSLMNARTMTGWTTHGHSAADVSIYGYGEKADQFSGHWKNSQIGQLLSNVFNVKNEQETETKYIQKLFKNGQLKICDPTNKLDVFEWRNNVSYPKGNLLYGSMCVEYWQ